MDFTYKFLTNYWFVWSIFLNTAIICAVGYCNKKERLLIYSVIIIVSLFVTDRYNLAEYKFMFPYACIAYEYGRSEKKLPKSRAFLLATWGGTLISLLIYSRSHLIHVSGISLFGAGDVWMQLWIDISRWIFGLISSVFIIELVKVIVAKYNNSCGVINIISDIGRYSLPIYIIHVYIIHYIIKIFRNSVPYTITATLLEAVFVLLCTSCCIYLLKKIRIYKCIF